MERVLCVYGQVETRCTMGIIVKKNAMLNYGSKFYEARGGVLLCSTVIKADS